VYQASSVHTVEAVFLHHVLWDRCARGDRREQFEHYVNSRNTRHIGTLLDSGRISSRRFFFFIQFLIF